jgi:hypothetical protein
MTTNFMRLVAFCCCITVMAFCIVEMQQTKRMVYLMEQSNVKDSTLVDFKDRGRIPDTTINGVDYYIASQE